MKGLTQLKKRNTSRNSLTAHRNVFAAYLANRNKQKVIDRERLEKQANVLIAMKLIKKSESGFEAETPLVNGFKRTFQIARAESDFKCDCVHFEQQGICQHSVAAARLDAQPEQTEKPFKAVLEYGNRKGLDFTKQAEFETKEAAARWLVEQAQLKLCPSGSVTDQFGATIFELTDEFFEIWEEAA